MNAIEAYRARKKLQTDGIWVEMLVGTVKIRHMRGNTALIGKVKSLGKKLETGTEEQLFPEMVSLLADHVVLDWEGFGESYSKEKFIVLCNELGPDSGFVSDIAARCMDMKLLDEAAIALASKN